MNEHQYLYYFLGISILSIFSIWFYFSRIKPFLRKRSYIKIEMGRSFSGKEYRYWKKELNRLYLSQVPIVCLFVK